MRGMQHYWTHPNWVRWWTQCHTSLPHSLLATPTKHNERPPQPLTIGYKDPPPRSRNSDDRPQMSMGAQHHHQQTATIAHWPQGPTTTINKRPRGTTPTVDEWPQGETQAEGDPQGMWQNKSAFWSPPAHPSIHAQINGNNPWKPTSDEDRPLQPPTNNNCPPQQEMGTTTHKKRGAPVPRTHEQSLCTPSTCTFENPCPWMYIHITTKSHTLTPHTLHVKYVGYCCFNM